MATVIISGKTLKLTKALKDYVTKKMRHAVKFSPLKIKATKVELDHDRNQRKGKVFRVELSVTLPGKIIKAGQKGESMRQAIDLSFPKLERQIKKYKTKILRPKQPGGKTIRKSE